VRCPESGEVVFARNSIVDDAGRVFFYRGKVYRAITSQEHADLYHTILQEPWIEEAFKSGLVRTRVCPEISLPGSLLTLEHESIPFETHPAEHTGYMHWLAAKAMVRVNLSLSKNGLLLKDAHPWNVMFQRGTPTIIDFGSITRSTVLPEHWFDEFRRYFAVPIWLCCTRWKSYAREYRRQHVHGFGLKLFEGALLNNIALGKLSTLARYRSTPVEFFQRLDSWLDRHKPPTSDPELWGDYRQCGDTLDPLKPVLPKQKFVFDMLSQEKPDKVLDFAANKGYYSEMAARLGAAVIACDIEEYCVDSCLHLAQQKGLAITPALLDFSWPTPCYGLGLYGSNSYERFGSDLVLALGLVHHICIAQQLPVEVFCDICMRYAAAGVVLEYVDPTDKHVASWGKAVPAGYSFEAITRFFGRKFPRVVRGEQVTADGLNRVLIFFGKEGAARAK
jgi:hypothetical protein